MHTTHLVWFKRDLRVHDHAALRAACQAEALLALYVREPAVHGAPDCSAAQRGFVQECLDNLDTALRSRGNRLWVLSGEAVAVLEALWRQWRFIHLHSHQETGNGATFARDQAVARWCSDRGVTWTEYTQDGVVRRLKHRNGWARRWDARNRVAPVPAPDRLPPPPALDPVALALPGRFDLAADPVLRQRGGRAEAEQALQTFLWVRGRPYQRAMSSPLEGEAACSRLSPYLAQGVLSLRETVAELNQRRAMLQAQPASDERSEWLASLRSFEGRLYWHCHFMQKLESEPAIEFENMVRAFDGLREPHFNRERFERWCSGHTGYPMVDACMRMLLATGWLNFRMRSMLVSFAAYPLWLHWREPALHLARAFVDYEPGIHYSQMQMQSGTTGINTLRIYNPIKQARDHDPDGHFVRRWLPELAAVPTEWIFEPWRLPLSLQSRHGCRIGIDYPQPVVDFTEGVRRARERMAAFRHREEVRREAAQVMERHGSRKSGMRQTGQRPRHAPQASASGTPAESGLGTQMGLEF